MNLLALSVILCISKFSDFTVTRILKLRKITLNSYFISGHANSTGIGVKSSEASARQTTEFIAIGFIVLQSKLQ